MNGMTPEEYATQKFNLIVDTMNADDLTAASTAEGGAVVQFFRSAVEKSMREDATVLLKVLSLMPPCTRTDYDGNCPVCLLRSMGIYSSL